MKIAEPHITEIRTAFDKMLTKHDLLALLNQANKILYGENTFIFELKQLTWFANPNLGGKRYREYTIKKKSGSNRTINAPVQGLKSLQKSLCFILQNVFEPHKAAMGFVVAKSIVDNANLHVGSKYVYNIDLKDFFSSIDQARVWKCLQLRPFNLSSEKQQIYSSESGFKRGYGTFNTSENENIHYYIYKDGNEFLLLQNKGDYMQYKKRIINPSNKLFSSIEEILLKENWNRKLNEDAYDYVVAAENEKFSKLSRLDLAGIIASISCTHLEVERMDSEGEWVKVKRNVLPQGAPTSPIITNIVCQRLDYLLSGVANRFGLKYSRYADDITFSSMHNVYQLGSDFQNELRRVIAEQGFHIKENKTRLQKEGYRQEVTGLLVNDKVNVQKRYIKQLRMWLYYWERYGYERSSGYFLQQYVADKGHVKKGNPNMANVIAGKLDYLKMVKGNENRIYLQLLSRFVALTNNTGKIELIIAIWEKFGIDKAIYQYYKNSYVNE